MPRTSFPSSPTAVASGSPGSGVPHQFEVVFRPRSATKRIVLQSATDANQATMAFHEALQQLTAQGATGELLVRTRHRPHHPLVRLPLKNQS